MEIELYDTDLKILSGLLPYVETISNEFVDLFSIEIRVKLLDSEHWAVLGWGMSGDPCIIRFEEDH